MAETQTPETNEQELSARESIAQIAAEIIGMEAKIFTHVDTAVKEMSFTKYGHVAGNLTAQDIGAMLKSEGVKPKLATELARGAVTRHESFRWSDKGKNIQSCAAAAKEEAKKK